MAVAFLIWVASASCPTSAFAASFAQSDFLEVQDQAEGTRLLKERKWPEAVIVFRSMLRKGYSSLPAYLGLSQALGYLGRREEALTVLREALPLKTKAAHQQLLKNRMRVLSRLFFSNSVFQLYQDGLNLIQLGKFRSARDRFEKSLELEPDNADVLLRLGQCLVLEGDSDSAAERLRLAKRINPEEPEVDLWLGRALQERGELKEGSIHLQLAYKALPHSERAAIWYAQAIAQAGQRMGAIQLLEKNLQTNPFHLKALLALAKMRSGKNTEDLAPLWAARKDLQLLLSRIQPGQMSDSSNPEGVEKMDQRLPSSFEGELGIELSRSPQAIKEEAEAFLKWLDERIQKIREEEGAHPSDPGAQ